MRILRNELNGPFGEGWKKFRQSLKQADMKGAPQIKIDVCSENKVLLPFQTTYKSYKVNLQTLNVFWQQVYSFCDIDRAKLEKSGRKPSKKAKEWTTKGNEEDYDMNKVLEALGEIKPERKEKKQKAKKKKKKDNSKTEDNAKSEDNPKTEDSNKEESFALTDDLLKSQSQQEPVSEQASGAGIESVQEYIDSVEQENRCLKMSQQFYDAMEKDNQKMKKDLEKVNESKLCKVCMDEEACIVFIPCGHLMSCVNCSPALKNCAICRKPVQTTVRTYFS